MEYVAIGEAWESTLSDFPKLRTQWEGTTENFVLLKSIPYLNTKWPGNTLILHHPRPADLHLSSRWRAPGCSGRRSGRSCSATCCWTSGTPPRMAAEVRALDWKLELIPLPVSDVDRAKAFYTEKVGFNADVDQRVDEQVRFVQLTPPGSA